MQELRPSQPLRDQTPRKRDETASWESRLIATLIACFGIVFTGAIPAALSSFAVGAMRWMIRIEAYVLLLVDEYPPFALDA